MRREQSQLPTVQRLLLPLSGFYGLAIRARNVWYDRLPAASRGVDLPVISIGNVTAGGTGKTPIVMETVRRLRALGRKPAILTRGYGAASGEQADEVLEYSRVLPDVPIIVEPNRVAGAQMASRKLGADCVVMDDGFQHRRLRRDLDVVLIDALRPWGGGWLLPAGRLREPLSSLRRASLFVISRSNQAPALQIERIEAILRERAPQAAVVAATVELEGLVYPDGSTETVEALAYHNVLPVCGIGNPATFLHSVERLAGRVCPAVVFRDHQPYRQAHVRKILMAAGRHGADLVVTTRKDWVKLAPLWSVDDGVPTLVRLDVRFELRDEKGIFDDHLQRALEARA